MKYRLCTNGRGVLLTREIVMLEGNLVLELDGETEGYTVVIKSGENVCYRSITGGIATLDKKHICSGPIHIFIIKDGEFKRTWTCDGLYAVVKDEQVAIGGNMLEYDQLLTDLRIENEDFRVRMKEQEAELAELRQHYDEIYEGYENL